MARLLLSMSAGAKWDQLVSSVSLLVYLQTSKGANMSATHDERPTFGTYWRRNKDDATAKSLIFVQSDPTQPNNKGMSRVKILFVSHEPSSSFI